MFGLTKEQRDEIKQELVSPEEAIPVRFLRDGQNINIVTGLLKPKGTNVIYHDFYWLFSEATALKVAKYLGSKAVFDTSNRIASLN